VYLNDVGTSVKRLHREQELDRKPETFRKAHMRYRYFKRLTLDGPIADLDRAFHGDEEVTA
jgi:hypothetical protein